MQPGARSSASGRAPGSGNDLEVEAPPCHFKRSVVLLLEPHVSSSAFSAFFSTARLGFIYISEMPDVISFPSGEFLFLLRCSARIDKFSAVVHLHPSAVSRFHFFSLMISFVHGPVFDPCLDPVRFHRSCFPPLSIQNESPRKSPEKSRFSPLFATSCNHRRLMHC